MELTGKIIDVLPEKSGTSTRGPWRKQEYVIEIPGEYPKQVCFMAWGDRIEKFGIEQGQELTVHFDLESREYNDRWYTDVKAWRVEHASENDQDSAAPDPGNQPPPSVDDMNDDIPF